LLLSWATNFSSDSKASSNGKVTWTEPVVVAAELAGEVEALGAGVGCVAAVFELTLTFELDGAMQAVKKHKTTVRIEKRWIMFGLLVRALCRGGEQQAFQR
jgi:hypothetical protein